jgi:hypothetical protein
MSPAVLGSSSTSPISGSASTSSPKTRSESRVSESGDTRARRLR